MISYRDMSFCDDADSCPVREGCPRYFSEAEKEKAVKWWGDEGVPVAFMPMAHKCERLISTTPTRLAAAEIPEELL